MRTLLLTAVIITLTCSHANAWDDDFNFNPPSFNPSQPYFNTPNSEPMQIPNYSRPPMYGPAPFNECIVNCG